MYELARGPLVWISLVVFLLGTVYQVFRFYALSRKVVKAAPLPSPKKKKGFSPARIRHLLKQVRHTVFALHPVTMAVSVVFHTLLFVVPLFLLGHTELITISTGLPLWSLPEQVSDKLAIVVLACCVFFLLRRIFLARVRSISSVYDYLVLLLAIVPFWTGFLAYHQIGDYRHIMTGHMISGELMLMAIPFTKLTHMIFFFLNRFLIVNEHTLGKGSRVW